LHSPNVDILIIIKIYRICILSGDVSPVDVISHIPVICENKDVPYIYVRSRMVINKILEFKINYLGIRSFSLDKETNQCSFTIETICRRN